MPDVDEGGTETGGSLSKSSPAIGGLRFPTLRLSRQKGPAALGWIHGVFLHISWPEPVSHEDGPLPMKLESVQRGAGGRFASYCSGFSGTGPQQVKSVGEATGLGTPAGRRPRPMAPRSANSVEWRVACLEAPKVSPSERCEGEFSGW
jgi:hypothetical protein